MLRSYLTIAGRTLWRDRRYAALNLAGLGVGLAACLLIAGYVVHELSFDRFHTQHDRIVRVATEGVGTLARAPVPMAPRLADDYPEIEATARFFAGGEVLVASERLRRYEAQAAAVDPAFFDIFDFPIRRGDASALARPFTLMLSETLARRYFGEADPIGRTLRIDNRHEYEVVGVFEDVPSNSHLQFDAVRGMASFFAEGHERDRWDMMAYTYVLLEEGQTAAALEAKLAAFAERHVPQDAQLRRTDEFGFALTPLTDIRLYAGQRWEITPQNDVRYVALFAGIALLILVIACVNYVNLATARAVRRAREVGVRKVMGATRGQLVRQFWTESLVLSVGALGLALGLAGIARPWFNAVMDTAVRWPSRGWGFGALAVAVGIGLVAGSYPALYLSRFHPTRVLKGPLQQVGGPGVVRKGLIVFQFGVSIALIAATLVFHAQMQLVQTSRPGFDRAQLVVIETRDGALQTEREAFRAELLRHPRIEAVSTEALDAAVSDAIHFLSGTDVENADPETTHMVPAFNADPYLLDTFGLKRVQGRNLTGAEHEVLVNEAAVEDFGWEVPLGKQIEVAEGRTLTVVGVVEDFHHESLYEAVRPTLLYPGVGASRRMAVRVAPGDMAGTLAYIEDRWDDFVPEQPFVFAFLDDRFDALYRQERRLAQLFTAAAGLAVFVACLGLLGLAAFIARQRTQEIGIRKVLGASAAHIVALLSKDFARLVAAAFVLAAPAAYWALQQWLEDFAYRIDLGPWIFLGAGALALTVAMTSVGVQVFRAAQRDPAKSLRDA